MMRNAPHCRLETKTHSVYNMWVPPLPPSKHNCLSKLHCTMSFAFGYCTAHMEDVTSQADPTRMSGGQAAYFMAVSMSVSSHRLSHLQQMMATDITESFPRRSVEKFESEAHPGDGRDGSPQPDRER